MQTLLIPGDVVQEGVEPAFLYPALEDLARLQVRVRERAWHQAKCQQKLDLLVVDEDVTCLELAREKVEQERDCAMSGRHENAQRRRRVILEEIGHGLKIECHFGLYDVGLEFLLGVAVTLSFP